MMEIDRLERLCTLIENVNDEHVYAILIGILEAETTVYLNKYIKEIV